MLSPKLRVVLRVCHFDANAERVALHKDSASQHRLHVELPRYLLQVRCLMFVTKD